MRRRRRGGGGALSLCIAKIPIAGGLKSRSRQLLPTLPTGARCHLDKDRGVGREGGRGGGGGRGGVRGVEMAC